MSQMENIKQLREQTGAGMMDCSKALEEAGDDMEKAIEVLRKKGIEKAGKKADRATKEGLTVFARQGNKVAAVTLLCETDFVARNDDFIAAVSEFAQKLLSSNPDEFKTWASQKITNELIVKIGENIQLGNFGITEGEMIGNYLHSDNKQAATVVVSGASQELADELAMQVVAMQPEYLTPEDVPADVLEKEKEIYQEQMKNEGKPEEVIEKIIIGKLNKFYSDVCLVKQVYIKDDKKTIEGLLEENGAQISSFTRYSV